MMPKPPSAWCPVHKTLDYCHIKAEPEPPPQKTPRRPPTTVQQLWPNQPPFDVAALSTLEGLQGQVEKQHQTTVELRTRQVEALETIADSLKAIANRMENPR